MGDPKINLVAKVYTILRITFLLGLFCFTEFVDSAESIKSEGQKQVDPLTTGEELLLQGTRLWGEKRFEEAAQLLKAALAIVEKTEEKVTALQFLEAVYKDLGRPEDVIEDYKNIIHGSPDESELHRSFGTTLTHLGKWQEAIESYKEAIRLNPNFADAYYDLGSVYGKIGHGEEEIESYKQAVRVKPDFKWAYYILGFRYTKLSRPEDAIESYKQAVKIDLDFAEACFLLGLLYKERGSREDAMTAFTQASTAYRKTIELRLEKDKKLGPFSPLRLSPMTGKWYADDYLGLGAAYAELGHLQEASEAFKQAIYFNPGEVAGYKLLGRAYQELGSLQEAIETYKEAVLLKPDDAEIYDNLLNLLLLSGQFSEAFLRGQQFREEFKKHNGTAAEMVFLVFLSEMYGALGDTSNASKYSRQALELFHKFDRSSTDAAGLNIIGYLHQTISQYDDAFRFYQQALDQARQEKTQAKVAEILVNMGSAYIESGDYNQAVIRLKEAAQAAQGLINKGLVSRANVLLLRAFNGLGVAQTLLKQPSEAFESLQKAEMLSRQLNLSWITSFILTIMGESLEEQGKTEEALVHYTKAIAGFELAGMYQLLEELKISFQNMIFPLYSDTVALFFKLYDQEHRRDYVEQAFLTNEKGKARTLLDLLEEARVHIREGISPDLRKEEEKIATQISSAQRVLKTQQLSGFSKKLVLNNLEEYEQSRQALQVKMALSNPKYAELTAPRIADIPQIQALLDKDTLFLEYALGEKKSFLWGMTKDGMQVYELPVEAEVSRQVEQYLSALKEPPPYGKEEMALQLDLGKSLYRTLLQLAESQAQGKSKLIIVPDGILHEFPFEALITGEVESLDEKSKESFQSVPYLGKRYTVTYTPSASVLVSLEKNRSNRSFENSASQLPLLAFGDPQYDAAPEPPTMALNVRGVYEERGGVFQRLKYSAQEVEKIAKVYGITLPSEAVNIQEQATEKHLREMDLTRYRILHFATHAIVGDEMKWVTQPALVLSQDRADDVYDGFLQMGEIFNLRLNADLVVLSACDTGKGKLHRGEGIVGLTRAFFYAGTPSVVASLWKVDDQSTSILMEAFYRNLKEGKSKAEALQVAKTQLMQTHAWRDTLGKEQSFDAPYFWAPFVLIGSGS